MPQWVTFVAVTGVVLVSLLVLSHLSQSAFADGDSESAGDGRDDPRVRLISSRPIRIRRPLNLDRTGPSPNTVNRTNRSRRETTSTVARIERTLEGDPVRRGRRPGVALDRRTPRERGHLPGLFALVLLGAVVYTGIPADALGIEFSRSYVEQGILWGTVAGILLYVSNEVGASVATRFGFDHDEQLRELLAPGSVQGGSSCSSSSCRSSPSSRNCSFGRR